MSITTIYKGFCKCYDKISQSVRRGKRRPVFFYRNFYGIECKIMDIIRPSINENNETITENGVIIYDCIMSDNGDIRGITPDKVKALYKANDNKWYFGMEISRLNLISLADRTKEERQRLGSIGGNKAQENREKKRNIQDVAKALLDSMVSDKVIDQYIEHPETMQGKTGADLLIHAMMEQAIKSGNYHCAEFVRDTAGYKPKNEVEIQADIMTESDRMLIDKVSKVG